MSETEAVTETKPKRKSYRDTWAEKLAAKFGVTPEDIKAEITSEEKEYEVSPRVAAISELLEANKELFAQLAAAVASAKGEDPRTLGIYVDGAGASGVFGRTGRGQDKAITAQ